MKFEKGIDLLLAQLQGSQDARSRAEAAKGLGRLKNGKAIEGLRKGAARGQFWHVRASALKALGEIGTPAALEALLSLGLPEERRVRRGLAEALGNFKDERARSLLRKLLEGDPSPYVRCESALALAKSWPEGALPHLVEAMKDHTPNETLGEACLAAMGKVKTDEADRIVRESLAYGRPTRVRIGAMKAIKERGRILDAEVPVLREIIGDPRDYRVRLFAVDSLVRPLGDRRFMEAVEKTSRSDREGHVRRKALETYYELSASAEASSALTKLRAEVDLLKEENRRLATAPA